MTAQLEGFFPLIVSPDVKVSQAFYERYFGYTCMFDSGWYVHLIHGNQGKSQLGIVVEGHDSVPEGFREPTRNFILSLEVKDARLTCDRLRDQGLPMTQELKDEPWGQRHFMVSDPTGNLVDVIEWIPPTKEYAEKYLTASSS